nr:spore coat protein [Priestia megaterium]
MVKDSEGVTVNTTDAQVAIQLQVAIQVAIAAVVAILTSNVNQGEVAEEMTALLGLDNEIVKKQLSKDQ